jgi:hypothetical protein
MIKYLQNKLLLAFLITFINVSSVTTLCAQYPEGTIHGLFSVSDSTYVFFSQGNLQYIGSASTPYWKFADNQWDYLGINTGQNSIDQNKDRDLFGWGTSGYNHGATCYQPWSTSGNSGDYYAYGSYTYNLYDQTGQADWGYNAIINGGNLENSGWRTLKKDEWQYVLNSRSTQSGIRYAMAKVNNVNGVVLLPDDWSTEYYTLNSTNSSGASYSTNVIMAWQWRALDQHGAVFLPDAGYRDGTSVYNVGSNGAYWSASYYNGDDAYFVYFYGGKLLASYSNYRKYGLSVRLVRPAQNCSFGINATPSPAEGGAVSGVGAYSAGAVCTLTAMPSAGYAFAFWSEAGIVVSTNASYTFTVLRSRNLVANFVSEEYITFADANVKALCVANWDANGDGELSYVEAAGVTNLGNVFKNNTSIHSFNELQHFVLLGSIGEQAFYGCTELTQITIPEQVTIVGSKAFWNCPALQTVTFNAVNCTSMQTTYNSNTNYSVFSSDASGGASALTRVVIGGSVQRIPDYAFKGSVDIYQRLVIPASVIEIGNHAFEGCNSLVQMVIQGNGLLAIGEYAFNGCSALRSALNLPNSVTSIGQYAFYGCEDLPSVTIGTGMETVGGYAFWNCPALTTVHFNATNCTSMVTNLQYSVFNSGTTNGGATPIVTLTIAANVTNIPDYAFRNGTNMSNNLNIPNSVTNIGQYAFAGCTGQGRTLLLGNNVATIGQYAFDGCSGFIGDLVIPNSVESIGQYAFNNCSGFNGNLSLPVNDSLAIMNQYTFNGCSGLTGTLTIPANVTEVAHSAFRGCSGFIGVLVLHDAMTTIGQYAFDGCSSFSGNLVIPNAVTILGQYAFRGCSGFDGSLVIGSGVQTINNATFENCSGFQGSLIVGRQVNSIGSNAFKNCNGFSVLISENPTPPTASSNSFQSMDFSIPAYVPYAMIPDYQSAAGWSQFTNYVEQCVFDQLDNDLWSDETNWYAFELPGPNDVVCVNSNCHLDMDAEVLHIYVLNLNDVLTVNSGNTLNTNYGIGILQPSQLVLQEGSQLINNLPGLHGTMRRQIPGYGSGNGGWFTVSAPIYRGASVSPLTTGSYDLYAYDEPTAMWLNQRDEATALESFIPGHGYLYAHQDGFAMQLAGQLNPSNADISVPVTCQHGLLPGFNLLGNPYTNNININSVKFNNTPITSYYKAVGGSQLVAYTDADNDAIQPIEGFFVQVPADGTVYFNTPSREEQGSYIRLVLNKDEKMLDRAYLRMNDGATLNKAFVEGHPSLLYLSVDGQPYAVAPQGRQAYNLCFVPVEEGSFVIECNLLHTECDYLHLIDTFTGEEVDLLATPSYSFKASAHDSQNRFALVLSADALPVEATANHRNRDAVPVLPSHGSNTSQYGYSSNAVVINATANPAEGGTVTGAGTYANGSTVTLTATANEGYTFVNWTENDNVVSTNATYTFVVNEGRTLVANFNQNSSEINHTTALTNGWNWWSTYIELNGNDGLAQLENSLGSHGMMIKSRENGFVEPYNVNGTISWYGNLTSICNEQMYMIRTDAACQAAVTGQAASPANHSVTLNPGWNWIGFMGQQPVSVGAAMSGVTPEGDDVLKGRNSYATYYAGDGNWYGTLNTLEPGQGYMYQSNSNAAQTLTYNTGRAGDTGANLTPEHNVFRPAADNHAHNMTVTAVVEADGAELRSGLYELAAFVGDDCRGSVKLIHVEALDRYVAFLTVFGEPDEPLAFRLTDGTATALAAETMAFSIDGTRGSLTNPCVLRFGSLSVEDMSLPQVSVYPNPSDGVFCVEGRDIERVEAYNTLGQLVLRQETHADRLKVDLTSQAHGVYTLRVVTTQGVSIHTVITK